MTYKSSPSVFAAADEIATRSSDAIALVARLLIGWLFLTNGWTKLIAPSGLVTYLTYLGVPNPDIWAWPAIISELVIGIALIVGIATRYVALYTLIYLIIATALAHRYWEYPAAQQVNQYAHFCKNLALMGGALLLYVTGAGRYAIDAMMRRR